MSTGKGGQLCGRRREQRADCGTADSDYSWGDCACGSCRVTPRSVGLQTKLQPRSSGGARERRAARLCAHCVVTRHVQEHRTLSRSPRERAARSSAFATSRTLPSALPALADLDLSLLAVRSRNHDYSSFQRDLCFFLESCQCRGWFWGPGTSEQRVVRRTVPAEVTCQLCR